MLMWLSFADKKFLGVVITEAENIMEAASKCWRLGVNPGGEVMGFEIPEDAVKERAYPRDTLLSEEFLKADGHKKLKDCPPEVQRALDDLKCEAAMARTTKNGCEVGEYHGDPYCLTHQCGPLPALQCKNKGRGCPHCDTTRPDYYGKKTEGPSS